MWSLDPSWQVSAPSKGAIFPLLSLHKTRGKERITKNDYSTLINGNHAPISSRNDHIGRYEALEVVGDPIVVSIGTLTLPGFALLRRVKMQECPHFEVGTLIRPGTHVRGGLHVEVHVPTGS